MNTFEQIVRENICGDGYDSDSRAEEIVEAHNKSIVEMIWKQIPKKPIGKSESYHNYDDSGEVFYLECPVCGNRVSISDYDDFEEDLIDNYCSNCGQKISKEYVWEGEEEE